MIFIVTRTFDDALPLNETAVGRWLPGNTQIGQAATFSNQRILEQMLTVHQHLLIHCILE
jgi:hypothetical protein